ncbi:MAG: DUF6088 family protein [Fulvivirga sp.]
MATVTDIQKYINQQPAKAVVFTEDFKSLGSSEAIKSALHRLVKTGVLHRLAKGIYIKPGFSALLQSETQPTLEEIAQAIAKRDRIRLIPTGAMALYKLGLSTQLPLKPVYLTDGTARKIPIGKRSITFKRVAPKKVSLKGELSTLVVQALGEIGKDQLTEEEKEKLIGVLKKEKYEHLKHDIRVAPQWMGEIMAKAIN